MAASITSSKRILANLFLLLANQIDCAEWWFGFNTKDKDLNDINNVEPLIIGHFILRLEYVSFRFPDYCEKRETN